MKQNKKSEAYLDRDVSWMYFNRRILQEAARKEIPLLERMSFLGIYSNNLDEFFRVRMAYLNRQAESPSRRKSQKTIRAKQIIKKIGAINEEYSQDYSRCFEEVCRELEDENIFIVTDSTLTEEQKLFIRNYYDRNLNGFISPVWLSAIKTFAAEPDKNIFLAVKVKRSQTKVSFDYAYIELPVELCGRFLRLPDKDGKSYIMYLDDVIRFCLPMVFEGLDIDSYEAYAFKFTKDAEMEIDKDPRSGKMQKIAKGIKSRRHGEPLRLIHDTDMPQDLLNRVLNKLDLDSWSTHQKSGRYLNHKDLMGFPDCGRSDLRYVPYTPILKKELSGMDSLLEVIQKRDRFIHVPYHSFDSYIRVLQEAASNKMVAGIKITLYRLASVSKVIRALVSAARNGKNVTVVIELLARFDEAQNINWSKMMQDAGINVIFGIEGLKVHSKITYITMKKGPDIACISTGNFHEGNARMYTDCILMTARRSIVREISTVFDFIEHPYMSVKFKELLVSPNDMKNKFVNLIDNEIKNSKDGREAYIKIKINHITDPAMISKLYDASMHGVRIDLLVRGNCSIIPGIKGVSENIRIVGIIDRFLEHSRIFIFANGGNEKYFMGSADWMPRNLNNRIEVVTPVYDVAIQKELKRIVDYGLRDNMQGRIVDGLGTNAFNVTDGDEPFRSQEALYNDYLTENN